jgi:hypothetical protein
VFRRDPAPRGFRLDWASAVRNVYQVFIGQISLSDPTHLVPAIRWLTLNLPPPIEWGEDVHLRQSLAFFMDRNARVVHDRLHAAFAMPPCSLNSPRESEAVWLDASISIDNLLNQWLARHAGWLERHHAFPPVLRALRVLRARFAENLTIEGLAQSVGTSRTTFVLRFRRNRRPGAVRVPCPGTRA